MLFFLLFICQQSTGFADAVIATHAIHGTIPIKSWKSIRDKGIVKQNCNFSRGAASLATDLSFYGKEVTEKQIMEAMRKDNGAASFEDMAKVLPQFGFSAQGAPCHSSNSPS